MKNIKYILIAILISIGLFIFLGIVAALIPNPWFARMIKSNILDYLFLTLSSILMGTYISIYFYKKNNSIKCESASMSGFFGSFLSYSCPICIKFLVLLFGATALLTYFEPYRPILGFLSLILLSSAVYFKIKK